MKSKKLTQGEYNKEICRNLPCIRCKGAPPSEPHHIMATGRKLLEINDRRNLVPVCRECHTWFHKEGRTTAAEKCGAFRKFLHDNDWSYVKFMNKYLAPDFTESI